MSDDLQAQLRDILQDRRTGLLITQEQTIAEAADRIAALEADNARLRAALDHRTTWSGSSCACMDGEDCLAFPDVAATRSTPPADRPL